MKLLYAASPFCDQPTFKRLLILAEELTFMDRPSVTFGDWGTVGSDTPVRRYNWAGCPVTISAVSPPSGPADYLYGQYIESDLRNPSFCSVVLKGFRESDEFARRFIQFDGNYGDGVTGSDIVGSLRGDLNLIDQSTELGAPSEGFFNISTNEARKSAFKRGVLIEASIKVTSTLAVAGDTGFIPISEDPYLAELVALRTSDAQYIGSVAKSAPYLGLGLVKSVIPDQALAQIKIPDILKYREKSRNAYRTWATEVNRAVAQIGDAGLLSKRDDVARIIAADLAPKLVESENEMKGIRDDLFAKIIKKVTVWEVPSFYLAHLAGVGFSEAMALFVAALTPTVPPVIDFVKDRRDVERRNAMTYLLKLSK